MKILVVEDDEHIASFLTKGLREESYTVDHCGNGEEALYLIQTYHYDLIILDIVLPGADGLSICEKIRKGGIQTPIIMLTARDRTSDKVRGLGLGADDYLTKPFAFEELLARIRVQLRKSTRSENVIKIADLTVDTEKRRVVRDNQLISLSAKEYALLELLARNQGRILTETVILDNLSDMETSTMSNTVNVYIYRLRNKIDKSFEPKLIHTIRGAGYLLGEKP